jgi:hypothetical protein
MARALQFIIGIVLLIALEIFRIYYIMPFPGSQESDTLEMAYFLHENIFYLRTIGIALILFPAWYYFSLGKLRDKILVSLAVVSVLVVAYLVNNKFAADAVFYQPKHKIFEPIAKNKIARSDLVIGININGESKAYPVELIGYHHQVRDSVGGEPIMVTYCTVCRTARIFSPIVDGVIQTFRLVGMDHFNAMFEDATTGSWWRQATGEAVAGPQKGKTLQELPGAQMTLSAWFEMHPNTLVMQPDSTFKEEYASLKNYDEGKTKSDLTRRDSLSWRAKSWVVGVVVGKQARAYDWNDLLREKIINDTLNGQPILVAMANDSVTFHTWKRDTLTFSIDQATQLLMDNETQSKWLWTGQCSSGKLQGRTLPTVQSYQEFWHSWETFHPMTTKHHSPN